jgi:predicted amidohydrolase
MIGGSCIVAPTGEIAAQTVTEADEVISVKCDLRLADNFRKNVFNFQKHRRPEHYRLIIERTGAGEPLGE